VAPRYREGSRAEKAIILDESVAATGYARKYAIRPLIGPIREPAPIQRRAPRYDAAVRDALAIAWEETNRLCGKRLVPFLPELVPSLERLGRPLRREHRGRLPAHADADRCRDRQDRVLGVAAPDATCGPAGARSGEAAAGGLSCVRAARGRARMGGMEYPERPTEDQITDWLHLYVAEWRRPVQARAWSAALPRLARILWLRYCVEPPLSLEAIAAEYGFRAAHASALAPRGLSPLARAEEQGDLPRPWDPESPLGRAVTRWRLQHRPFIPRPRPPGHG
jgi:hypothetical protein